jgi:phosphoglycerate dehydrogenase-like enzyme
MAVISGIKNKLIEGYLCDVLESEPVLENEILLGVENIIITPHVGSRTYENVVKQGVKAIINLSKYINENN